LQSSLALRSPSSITRPHILLEIDQTIYASFIDVLALIHSFPPSIPPPSSIMSVRRLGKYSMHETLGKGGFSKVRLGVDDATGERVALKILKKKEMGMSSDVIKQVEREIHAMSHIVHPNVLRLKEVVWDIEYEKKNGSKYPVILVVLELATGGELFDFLAFTGPFEEAIARTYFIQMMAGIAHCHSKGIAHRDIKPENLLLDSQFVLKLADFGFANTFNSVQRVMYTECGTPGYMAPEVFAKKGYDPQAADIWSCGVVLFIQIAGFPPFQRPALTDWWFNKLYHNKHHLFWEAHQRTAYFSDLVKDLLNKLLAPDPSKRITMAQLQKHPWMLGPTISHTALYAELLRRKQTVEEGKDREKAEKAAAAKVASGGVDSVLAQAGLLERGDVSMTRGEGPQPFIDPTAESLPAAIPAMTTFAKGALPGAQVGTQGGGAGTGANAAATTAEGTTEGVDGVTKQMAAVAVLGDDAFASVGGEKYEGEEGDTWATPATASSSSASSTAAVAPASSSTTSFPTPPPPFPSSLSSLQSFTRFHSKSFASPLDLFQRLTTTFITLGCHVLATNVDKYKFKRVKCVTASGIIEFAAAIYSHTQTTDSDSQQTGGHDQSYIVDFKKVSGDSAQWRVLYAELRHNLIDLIAENQPQHA